jgi:hypothetical protein
LTNWSRIGSPKRPEPKRPDALEALEISGVLWQHTSDCDEVHPPSGTEFLLTSMVGAAMATAATEMMTEIEKTFILT